MQRSYSPLIELAPVPRVVPDTHFDSEAQARREAKRRTVKAGASAFTRIQKSPYGGFVVVSIPATSLAQAIRATNGQFLRGIDGYTEYPDE